MAFLPYPTLLLDGRVVWLILEQVKGKCIFFFNLLPRLGCPFEGGSGLTSRRGGRSIVKTTPAETGLLSADLGPRAGARGVHCPSRLPANGCQIESNE